MDDKSTAPALNAAVTGVGVLYLATQSVAVTVVGALVVVALSVVHALTGRRPSGR